MSTDHTAAIADLLKALPAPGRVPIATDLVAGGVRFAPDERATSELLRLRQIDKVGALLKKTRLPPPARLMIATQLIDAGYVLDLPDTAAGGAPPHTQIGARPLGPEGDSPLRAQLRRAMPDMVAKIDTFEKARAEGDDSTAQAIIDELKPKAMAELQALRAQAAALTPDDFDTTGKAGQ